MKHLVLLILIMTSFTLADPTVILVLKTTSKPGLESETNALPDIVMSRLSKNPNYRSIVWDEIEGKLGKDKMAEILKCQDSSCIVNFTNTIKQYRLNPSYILFCSIAKYDGDYTITLKIADAVNGVSFGMISTTSSSLESFHTSGLIENVIKKIPMYVSRANGSDNSKVTSQLPGMSALGRDTSYFSLAFTNDTIVRSYVNMFCYHDERKGLIINKEKPIDTMRFPVIAAYKSDTGTVAFTLTFLDSLIKNRGEYKYTVQFQKDTSNLIKQIVYTTEVPPQNRFASDYIDLKKSMLDKLSKSGFILQKSDSISGLYGVNYRYYYSIKYDITDVNLVFTAESSKFNVVLSR